MEYRGKIKFYEEEMDVPFPEDFNLCKKKIGEMVGLPENELLQKISLYYNDEDNDKILLTEESDYKIFFNYLKENNPEKGTSTMFIELKENSEILVKKISQEMNVYKEKYSKEINLDKKNEENIDNNSLDKMIEEKLIIKDNDEDINNKIPENNHMEEIININENENKEIPQNNNINKEEHEIKYEETCQYCKTKPLYDVFYYCLQCNIIMCSNCELEFGKKHSHPFSKIQTYDQYMNSHINLRGNINNAFQNIGGGLKNILGNLNNIFNNRNNNRNNNVNNNMNNNMNNNQKNYKDLAQNMKNEYELNNLPDEKIEEALIIANGDFNKAFEYLFS